MVDSDALLMRNGLSLFSTKPQNGVALIDPHGSAGFVLDSPAGLSLRAQRFLARAAIREQPDLGLTGDVLRARMLDVYGQVDEDVVRLLASTQQRYSGLSYFSGFFDSKVTFSPLCAPESREEALEISYAIETGSPTGASLKRDGAVEIGLDSVGIVALKG